MSGKQKGKLIAAAAREGMTVPELIQSKRNAGLTYYEIAVALEVYPRAIQYWVKRGNDKAKRSA